MDRRRFLESGLSAIFACACCIPAPANTMALQGCRAAVGQTSQLNEGIKISSGREAVDRFCRSWHSVLAGEYKLRPGFCFVDDENVPNAYATPEKLLPDGPDGTVLIGVSLLNHEIGHAPDPIITPPESKWEGARPTIAIILAHEFGHIMQYKYGMSPDGPWQMEPHADFLAGWALGRQLDKGLIRPREKTTTLKFASRDAFEVGKVFDSAAAVRAIFEKGDTLFYSREHHGEPEFRAAMVLAGYDAKKLNLKAAFEKGRLMAGVSRL